MANPLAGDYDAVVQVSSGTINRVLAALHQNAFTDPNRPSFPHTASFRIGDDGSVHGHRGWVQGQIGVPRIELINRSTDRFHLEVTVRARYRGDAGSVALPEYINGTVRADYQIVDIDPTCFGWRATASDHVWVRVVRGSVSFDGTAMDDSNPALIQLAASTADEATTNKRITRLIETLLTTRFEANRRRRQRQTSDGRTTTSSRRRRRPVSTHSIAHLRLRAGAVPERRPQRDLTQVEAVPLRRRRTAQPPQPRRGRPSPRSRGTAYERCWAYCTSFENPTADFGQAAGP